MDARVFVIECIGLTIFFYRNHPSKMQSIHMCVLCMCVRMFMCVCAMYSYISELIVSKCKTHTFDLPDHTYSTYVHIIQFSLLDYITLFVCGI